MVGRPRANDTLPSRPRPRPHGDEGAIPILPLPRRPDEVDAPSDRNKVPTNPSPPRLPDSARPDRAPRDCPRASGDEARSIDPVSAPGRPIPSAEQAPTDKTGAGHRSRPRPDLPNTVRARPTAPSWRPPTPAPRPTTRRSSRMDNPHGEADDRAPRCRWSGVAFPRERRANDEALRRARPRPRRQVFFPRPESLNTLIH